MKNLRLFVIFDTLFAFVAIFVLALAACNFFITLKSIRLSVAILIAFIFATLIMKKNYRLSLKQNAIRAEKEHYERIMKSLISMPTEKLLNFFASLFKESKKNFIRKQTFLLLEGNVKAIFLFFFHTVSLEHMNIYLKNLKDSQKLLVFAVDFDSDAKEYASLLCEQVKLIDGKTLYKFMKKFAFFPPLPKETQKKKPKGVSVFKKSFTRKRSIKLFLSGLVLMAFGFFTFFPLYYIIFGSILIFLSIIYLFFGKTENKNKDDFL